MRALCLAGLVFAACFQGSLGCSTSARQSDSAALLGLWKGEVDTFRNHGGGAAAPPGWTPRILRIAAIKGEGVAVGRYGYTKLTGKVDITVVRTGNRIGVSFITGAGNRVELTLMDDDTFVGDDGAAVKPMKLQRVAPASTSN